MSLHNKAAIVGIGETPTDRLGSKPGEPRKSSAEYISWAMHLALEDAGRRAMEIAGVKHSDIDYLQHYDDYVIVVYLQIEDLGFCAQG
jgi:hypothetical protein